MFCKNIVQNCCYFTFTFVGSVFWRWPCLSVAVQIFPLRIKTLAAFWHELMNVRDARWVRELDKYWSALVGDFDEWSLELWWWVDLVALRQFFDFFACTALTGTMDTLFWVWGYQRLPLLCFPLRALSKSDWKQRPMDMGYGLSGKFFEHVCPRSRWPYFLQHLFHPALIIDCLLTCCLSLCLIFLLVSVWLALDEDVVGKLLYVSSMSPSSFCFFPSGVPGGEAFASGSPRACRTVWIYWFFRGHSQLIFDQQ